MIRRFASVVLTAAMLTLPAGPAHAEGSVAIVGSELLISPDPGAGSGVKVRREGTTYLVEVLPRATPGAGCSGDASSFTVTCPDPSNVVALIVVHTGNLDSGVQNDTATPIFAETGGGDDVLAQSGTAPATLIGGPGNDLLQGGDGPDILRAGPGRDRVSARGGTDVIQGGAGRDNIKATDGTRDRVNGGAGRDRARVDAADRVRAVEREIVAG